MQSITTVTTLSLIALTLTACGGSTVTRSGSPRTSTITHEGGTVTSSSSDPVAGAYQAYLNGNLVCASSVTDSACQGHPSPSRPVSLDDYRACYTCMASPSGAYGGYPVSDLSASATPSYLAAMSMAAGNCCYHLSNVMVYSGSPPTALQENMTIQGTILNYINYSLLVTPYGPG